MKKITTSTMSIFLDRNDILRINILENVEIDIKEAIKNCGAIIEAADNKRSLIIVNTASNWTITTAARIYFVQENVFKRTIAIAFVTNSLSSRLVVNFFMKLHTISLPMKSFPHEEKAVEWLKTFKE